MANNIRVISFDLDDTLWPGMPTILAAENKLYRFLQENVSVITQRYDMMQLRDRRRELLSRYPELAHDLTALRLRSFEALADEFGLDREWIRPAFELFYEARQQVSLFPDVAPVLEALQQQYRLASLTNGNADPEKTGVAHWFEYSLNSITAGSLKSQPMIYRQLQRQMGVSAGEHVHVGDDPENDVLGAKTAGAFAIWLNREQKPWPLGDCQPDSEIQNLHALPAVLATLGRD